MRKKIPTCSNSALDVKLKPNFFSSHWWKNIFWAYVASLEPVTSNVVSGHVTFQDFSFCDRLFKDSLISEKKINLVVSSKNNVCILNFSVEVEKLRIVICNLAHWNKTTKVKNTSEIKPPLICLQSFSCNLWKFLENFLILHFHHILQPQFWEGSWGKYFFDD